MKLSHILWLFLTLTLPLTAGAETKATRLLDRVVEQINSPQGISLSFILRQGDNWLYSRLPIESTADTLNWECFYPKEA